MIGEFDDLRQTRVYSVLERRITEKRDPLAQEYTSYIGASFKSLHKYLDEVRRYFHQFTDHSITHSIRIVSRIGSFLDDEQLEALTTAELYLLIACPLMHDIGMVVGEKEVDALLKNPKFAEESKAFRLRNSIQAGDDWERKGIGRMFLTDYIRRHHGERARSTLLSDVTPVRMLTGENKAVASWIGKICEAHTRSFADVADPREFPDRLLLDERRVNTRFIAICLRLGDLLDINTNRVCPALRMLSEPLHFISKNHWDQYSGIEILETAPGKDIVIAGTCPTQDSHRVLKQWIGWLKNESANAVQLLSMSDARSRHYRLALGPVKDDVEPGTDAAGQPLYEFLEYKFNLDEEKVFKRLFGRELYGRVDVAFRELVQNAIDATRIRVAVECSSTESWRNSDANEKRQQFSQVYAKRRLELGLTLQVTRNIDNVSGKDRLWLKLTDQGIGMSRDVIRDYLLKVGRTRWREDERVRDLPVGTIGEFGIGFLSTFMISDRTVIRTQSCLPNEEGIEATIFTWDGYLATRSTTDGGVGTCVSLRLRDDACTQLSDLNKMVVQWCPYLELPIKLVGENGDTTILEPRAVGESPKRDKLTVVEFADCDSTVAVEGVSMVRGEGAEAAVCQDGIVIPEMLPPVLEVPEQQILRWRGIRINLLGKSRSGIQLSRGLLEGGQERFWSVNSQRVWAALATNGLKYASCRSALSEYSLAEYVRTKGQSVFLVGPGKRFTKHISNDLVRPESLCFGELDSSEVARWCPHEEAATCLIPSFSDLLVDEQFVMSTTWATSEDSESYLTEEDEYEHTRDLADAFQRYGTDAVDGTDADEQKDGNAEEVVSVFAGDQDGLAEYWASKLSEVEFPAATAFSGTVARLVDRFQCVDKGPSGYAMLTNRSGVSLRDVGAFRMSESWWAMRHISTGVWTAIFIPELTFGLNAKQMGEMDDNDYLLYLVCRMWSPVRTPSWGRGWPNKNEMWKLGKQLDDILAEGEDVNPYEPPYDNDELLEEWEKKMEDITEKELREFKEEWERDNFTSIYFREVAGHKLSQCLSQAIGPA
jgi:hypothetical protein